MGLPVVISGWMPFSIMKNDHCGLKIPNRDDPPAQIAATVRME